jgi:hypothetical protein
MAAWLLHAPVQAAGNVTVNVVDGTGAPVSGFRWLLQQDMTYPVDPSAPATTADGMFALGFHRSNHPAVTSGNSDTASASTAAPVADGRYVVSVLPYSGYSIGGTQTEVTGADVAVTVTVQKHPIPTAQIALFLFEDNWPLNGAPDLPEEENPGADGVQVDWSKFSIVLEEPAGRYGQNGGPMIQDAFGNPLGTSYDKTCAADGTPDANLLTNFACLNADGTPVVLALGDGTLHPDPVTGNLLIQNLAPGKYGVIVVPPNVPAGEPQWQQTTTIEGTNVIDAWVKANEPPVFVEFGLPGPHVFVGFTRAMDNVSGGPGTISGVVTDMHMSRPPNFQFYSGRLFPSCWVALNEGAAAAPGPAVYVQPCGPDSDFNIDGVPAGDYQLTIFDTNLDVVIATLPITVDAAGTCNGGGSCALGDVGVFNWFTRLNTAIFQDVNQNGFWDAGEKPAGAESGPVNVRWRDGTIYQSFPTDTEGFAPFDEHFPFFHWMVAEVGFTKDKATGVTVVVDAGGPVDTTTDAFPGLGELTPQPQCTSYDAAGACVAGSEELNPNTGDNLSRTEVGPVLTQAFQGFLGQTSVLWFGKAPYVGSTPAVFSPPNPPVPPRFVGENGGISGVVMYATTRAENDPQYAAAETWEPGVPRVQVNLYADGDIDCVIGGVAFPNDACDIDWNNNGGTPDPNDGTIDDLNGNGLVELADQDNYPLGWAAGGTKGAEDLDRDGDGVFDFGDAVAVTWSDSWDDSLPTDCRGANNVGTAVVDPPISNDRCFDGLRNFNQVRPGVFDGGYAFSAYGADALNAAGRGDILTKLAAFYADRQAAVATAVTAGKLPVGTALPDEWLVPGEYIVEAVTPQGYKPLEAHHKNVDFGDEYIPSLQALPKACVGDEYVVPALLAMATKDGSGDPLQLIDGLNADDAATPLAGETLKRCDRKLVQVSSAQNAAADFFVMTDVPIAGNVAGGVLNDLANEFNPASPAFGEKYAPPFVPVAFYDWNGALVTRVYADQYGKFNAVVPSTWTANLPQPSGMSPNMLLSCMNDAGPVPNPEYCDPAVYLTEADCPDGTSQDVPASILDPSFDPQYSQFCYTFQYMPGATTYLDTPVVSIAAYANPREFPTDCERPDRTPMIASVARHTNSRPVGAVDGQTGPFVVAADTVGLPQQIVIRSMGLQQVPNPAWDGLNPATKNFTRDYRFGLTGGSVRLEAADGTPTWLVVRFWNNNQVVAEVPTNLSPGDYQVVLTRAAGVPAPVDSPIGATLTVGVCSNVSVDRRCNGVESGVRPNNDGAPYTAAELYAVHAVSPAPYPATPIQDAIDAAGLGDLILVAPGAYEELVIMWKPVKLQGWGAGAVTLNARQVPTEKILNWRAKVDALVAADLIDPLPGQDAGPGFQALGAALFATEEGAGIFVAGKDHAGGNTPVSFRGLGNRGSRVDGFTVVGATQGGGIVVNGYASYLNIGNNRLFANAGIYGGGLRLGHPTLTFQDPDTAVLVYPDSFNDNVRVHHNHVVKNGSTATGGAGGGISLHTGAHSYKVQKNWICGNFSQGDGAGIGHLGLSDNGLIEDNYIVFNESFLQASPVNGGGIYIGGQVGLQATDVNGTPAVLTPGSGSVVIDANVIRGNNAGAGDGGGISLVRVNGADVAASLGNSGPWYDVEVYNNLITNNVAGLAAGGISVQDAVSVTIRHNTVANNDSTATTQAAFDLANPGNQNGRNVTTPQPAGVVGRTHTADLAVAMGAVTAAIPADSLTFSDPSLVANIVYQNRSFFWLNYDDPLTPVTETGLFPANCASAPVGCNLADVNGYTVDLGVLSGLVVTANLLDPVRSLLTDATGYAASNVSGDPDFVKSYFNVARGGLDIAEFTTLQTALAADEGGNFIQVAFSPLSLVDITLGGQELTRLYDYHIGAASAGLDMAGPVAVGLTRLLLDIDNQARPTAANAPGVDSADAGADEL